MNNYCEEERKICIMDCIWNMIFHWRWILISMVACSVLFCGLKYIKDYRTLKNNDSNQAEINSSLNDIEQQIEQLQGKDKVEAESAIAIVKSLVEKKEYANSSAVMKLDSCNVDSVFLQYYVKADDNTSELLQAYCNSYLTEEIKEKIVRASGDTITTDDINNMISSKNGGAGFQVNNANKSTVSIGDENSILYITVRGMDKEKAVNCAEVVKEALESYRTKATNIYGKHTLTLVSENYQVSRDEEILNTQNVLYDSIYYAYDRIKQLTSAMGSDAANLVEDYEIALDLGESYEQNYNEKEELEEKVLFSEKWLVLGALFGVFLILCLEVLYWLFGGRLNSAEELQNNFNVCLYGVFDEVKKNKKLKIIDEFFLKTKNRNRKTLSSKQTLQIILSRIILIAKNNNINKLYLTGTDIENYLQLNYIEDLVNELERENIKLCGCQSIISNSSALIEMTEIGSVVIFEETNVSKYQDIAHEFQMCYEQNVKILGAIVLKRY